MEQLYVSHHHKISDEICNCTMCPRFHLGDDPHIYMSNFCFYFRGRICEPEISWCNWGIVLMWMKTHKPNEVIDFLVESGKVK